MLTNITFHALLGITKDVNNVGFFLKIYYFKKTEELWLKMKFITSMSILIDFLVYCLFIAHLLQVLIYGSYYLICSHLQDNKYHYSHKANLSHHVFKTCDMKWCWVLLTPWMKDDGSPVKNNNNKNTFPRFGVINSWEGLMHPSERERSNTDSSCGWNDPNAHRWVRQTQPLTCLHSNRARVNDALWPFTSRWRPGGVSVTSAGWLRPLAVRVRSHMKISSSEKASFVSPPDKRRGWGITWNSPCLGCASGGAE